MSDDQPKQYDLVIIGAGPAALTAAIYTTREDINTVLYERGVVGGLAAVTDVIDNYPGFSNGVKGLDLAEDLRKQAERFGAKIELGEITAIKDEGEHKRLQTDSGTDILTRAVLIATGSDYNRTGIPGEEHYYARGVHFCATCDGAFYRDKRLVVIGAGNSAIQETIFLTRYASHIDILVRSEVKASEVLIKELQPFIDSGKVSLQLGITPKEIIGDGQVVNKVIGSNKDNQDVEFITDGVFVFIGLKPNTAFLAKSNVKLNSVGFIVTDANLETSVPGVFAAGDVRSGATMQIASASGEGATAALKIREYLEGRLHQTELQQLEVMPWIYCYN